MRQLATRARHLGRTAWPLRTVASATHGRTPGPGGLPGAGVRVRSGTGDGRLRGTGGTCVGAARAAVTRCRGRGYFQVSFRVPPAEPVFAVRLSPDSQVTFPEPSLTMYLYAKDVFAGRLTVADQTG